MRRLFILFTLLAIPVLTFAAKIPTDAWQSGILKDSSETWHTRGGGAITGNQYGLHGGMGSHEYPIVQYTIETAAYVYEVNLVLVNDRAKRPSLTVNSPIKFAIEKSNFYIKDEQGKQYKLVLDKKTLKATAPPQ